MRFENWLYNEMPITSLQLQGKWGEKDRPYKYDQQSIGILTNPKGISKIERLWSNTKQNFKLIFLRGPNVWKFLQTGEVSPETVKKSLGIDVQPDPDAITVIFTNNTATERTPLTAWTIAHRLGHALTRQEGGGTTAYNKHFYDRVINDLQKVLVEVYGVRQSTPSYGSYGGYGNYSRHREEEERRQLVRERSAFRQLLQSIGTMRSAREKALFRADEFVFEITAQYMMTGTVKFNPLPPALQTFGRTFFARRDKVEDWNNHLQNLADEYAYTLDSLLSSSEGKILVM